VASDFHARYDDFRSWLTRTDIHKRWKKGEDDYLLILGDAADRKGDDPQAAPDGDTRIFKDILDMRRSLGRRADRLIFLLGNHEWEVMQVYRAWSAKERALLTKRRALVDKLYAGSRGGFYRQFNFIERVNEETYAFLCSCPMVAAGPGGLVGLHAGPARSLTNLSQVRSRNETVLDEIVWHRPVEVKAGGYTPGDVSAFLKKFDRSSLLLCGHTPIHYLPPKWRRDGVGKCGTCQLILATSYGSTGGKKSYLSLSLDKRYPSVSALAPGKEILTL
jgi:hypothetical protein